MFLSILCHICEPERCLYEEETAVANMFRKQDSFILKNKVFTLNIISFSKPHVHKKYRFKNANYYF